MSLLTNHFVGRAEELGSFDEVLAEVDEGRAAAIDLGEDLLERSELLGTPHELVGKQGHFFRQPA